MVCLGWLRTARVPRLLGLQSLDGVVARAWENGQRTGDVRGTRFQIPIPSNGVEQAQLRNRMCDESAQNDAFRNGLLVGSGVTPTTRQSMP